MSADSILLERRDSIARVTLNRPDVLNSFDHAMVGRMLAVLAEVQADRSIRAMYLTGAGRGFCAGQDISGGATIGDYGEHVENSWNRIVRGIRGLEVPVICAVGGVAAGAGANLALACDFVVAAEETAFIQAFVNIGLVPDSGGSWIVPHLVGPARAAALLMLGDKLPAKQAAEWGLIHRAVPAASLEQEAWALAARLAAMPTLALGLIKKMISAAATNSYLEQLTLEAGYQSIAGRSRDHLEGVAAFREKRKPAFEGR
ncbi:MAG: 2-(1,2-epoxy-1,2-dihydrophenyl)acetyl-CoA isomerase [Gemmatimonadetes bacterium]|nr:2-(1,2-epoxy-1,2-dihydrophenyl)acetyl-CoA isomerase [Gemmatimonadota bacterium]